MSFRIFVADIFEVIVLGVLTRCRLVDSHQSSRKRAAFIFGVEGIACSVVLKSTRTQTTLLQDPAWVCLGSVVDRVTLGSFSPFHYHSFFKFRSSTIDAAYSLST